MNIRRTLPLLLAPLLVLAAALRRRRRRRHRRRVDGRRGRPVGRRPPRHRRPARPPATTGATAATTAADRGRPRRHAVAAPEQSITVGSADFPESQLLAQIYGQALAAAGFDVALRAGIGAREVYFRRSRTARSTSSPSTPTRCCRSSSADDPDAVSEATNVEEQITALGEVLPDGLEVLTPSTAEDKDVIVCTAEVAEELGLTTSPTSAPRSAEITLGAPPEFETRSPFGLVGFQEIYGARVRGVRPARRRRHRRRPGGRRRSTAATCSRRCRSSRPRASSPSRTTRTPCRTRPCCRSCAARS